MHPQSTQRFQELILEYSVETDPERRTNVEQLLWQEFGSEQVVFVLDMSGFSLITRKYGIIHYLSMVRRMRLISEPVIRSFSGSLIKYEADNCFAVFPDAAAAVHAAIALQLAFESSNLITPDEFDVHISCGIDYGRILIVNHEDCFGDAVNRASKLGEDVAGAGEIMITRDAFSTIPPQHGFRTSEVNISVSGITIPAYSVKYQK